MPVSAIPQGETPERDDTLNVEGGVAFWKTEGKVPVTSGQIKDGQDTSWARGEFKGTDEPQPAEWNPAKFTGKSGFGGHVNPANDGTVSFDPNKMTGKTAG